VLNLVRHGMTNRQIARFRQTSLDATKFHIANLLIKLDAPDRAALRAWTGAPYDSAMATKEDLTMTEALHLGRIGQISRQVSDIERAEEWYRDVLGLPHLFTFGNLSFFDCDGTRLFLSTPENGREMHEESVIYFQVLNINAACDELKSRGVKFQGAPHMIHRHPDGTEEWMAFFEDPDGGVLALMSRVAPKA
jgi:catechol 2,3-dioxygenase-like lactoylglutathione lyase family enzyme